MPNFVAKSCWLLVGWLAASTAHAVSYPLPPPGTDVIGQVKVIYANQDDTLLDIARRYSLGYNEMVQANPGVDRWTPGKGTPIVLPTRYILPDAPREGLVLNIAEMRLYYYPPAKAGEAAIVHTYPVSVGRMDWKTPLGTAKVIAKETDPVWRPPASIKAEHAAEGDILPDVVPSGPDNPLGRHAMRLSIPGYLIHGTDKPYGIGMRVTHGCLRLYPEDIERLYGMVPIGTSIRIMDQPVKVGRINGQLLIEAHAPLEEEELPITVTLDQAHKAIIAKTGPDMAGIDLAAVDLVVEQFSGIPVAISGGNSTENADGYSPAAPTPTAYSAPRPAATAAIPPPLNAAAPSASAATQPRPIPAPRAAAASNGNNGNGASAASAAAATQPRPIAPRTASVAPATPAINSATAVRPATPIPRSYTAYDIPRAPAAVPGTAAYSDSQAPVAVPDYSTPRHYAPVAQPVYQRPTAGNTPLREPPPLRAQTQP